MELHPLVFVLLAYGIAAVIAVLVAFIVKIISFMVQRKQAAAADEGTEAEGAKDKGGNRQ
jgi:hypothetical protein